MWDLNDFDEVTWGPWEWDLKRLAVSFSVAAREHKKVKTADRIAAIELLVTAYAMNLRRVTSFPAIEMWYHFRAPCCRSASRRSLFRPRGR